jgi:hypothetical protein
MIYLLIILWRPLRFHCTGPLIESTLRRCVECLLHNCSTREVANIKHRSFMLFVRSKLQSKLLDSQTREVMDRQESSDAMVKMLGETTTVCLKFNFYQHIYSHSITIPPSVADMVAYCLIFP